MKTRVNVDDLWFRWDHSTKPSTCTVVWEPVGKAGTVIYRGDYEKTKAIHGRCFQIADNDGFVVVDVP